MMRIILPFPPKSNDSPVSLLVRLFLHLRRKTDSAHNAITKFLIQHGLVCVSIVLHDLEQAVDQWLFGWQI